MKHVLVLTGLPYGLDEQQTGDIQRIIGLLLDLSISECVKAVDFPRARNYIADSCCSVEYSSGYDEKSHGSIDELLSSVDSTTNDVSKGCAFVTMHSAGAAKRAVEYLKCFPWPDQKNKSMKFLLCTEATFTRWSNSSYFLF